MKLIVASLLLASFSYAAPTSPSIMVQASLYANGELQTSPRIRVASGVPAEISQMGETSQLRLKTVTTVEGDVLRLNLDFEYLRDKQTLVTRTEIVTLPGIATTIPVGQDANGKPVTLQVTATPD